jgi:hypothetical protein
MATVNPTKAGPEFREPYEIVEVLHTFSDLAQERFARSGGAYVFRKRMQDERNGIVEDKEEEPAAGADECRLFTFKIVKRHTHESLGMEVKHCQGTLVVLQIVHGGAVDRANRLRRYAEPPRQPLRLADTILRVNSVEGSDRDMVAECREQQELILRVLRSHASEAETTPPVPEDLGQGRIFMFQVERVRADETLGIDAKHGQGRLMVVKIFEVGAVHRVNRSRRRGPGEVLQVNDIILSINGVSGSEQDMIQECRLRNEVNMQVFRAACHEFLAE